MHAVCDAGALVRVSAPKLPEPPACGDAPTRAGRRSPRLARGARSARLILLLSSERAIEHGLRAGELSCPACGAPVAPWGLARPRVLRTLAGPRVFAPRRARCSSCKKSHVVLPAEVVPRRRDDAQVIGSALLRAPTGASTGEIARELGRARTTVRNWLRRLEDNASAAQVIGGAHAARLRRRGRPDAPRLALDPPSARRRGARPRRGGSRAPPWSTPAGEHAVEPHQRRHRGTAPCCRPRTLKRSRPAQPALPVLGAPSEGSSSSIKPRFGGRRERHREERHAARRRT